MRVLILGIDGYIGWALAQYLTYKQHEVYGIDSLCRRDLVRGLGGQSVVPIDDMLVRTQETGILCRQGEAASCITMEEALQTPPDVIFNLAQVPSAPYSMSGRDAAVTCTANNVLGAMNVLWVMREHAPKAHLITLGTMGEYGTPDCPIIEPPIELGVRRDGKESWAKFTHFPRKPSSFYHADKVAITHYAEAASRFWGLKVTDVMQGVVYGIGFPGKVSETRKDVDEMFGTALDRFLAQASIGHPMTVYGTGTQTRGFLPLRDSLWCLELLMLHPPADGEYRTVNQFDEAYSINELAMIAYQAAQRAGLDPTIMHCDNPRVEDEDHLYEPETGILRGLGYQPAGDIETECDETLRAMLEADLVREVEGLLAPKTNWRPTSCVRSRGSSRRRRTGSRRKPPL